MRTTTRSRSTTAGGNTLHDDDDDDDTPQTYNFNGVTYHSYEEYVQAKRQRNRDVLASSGLLDAKAAIDNAALEQRAAKAASRGLKRSKASSSSRDNAPVSRRKSSRLSGQPASGLYVEAELAAGKVVVAGGGQYATTTAEFDEEESHKFFNNRVNDGSDLTVKEAIELCDSKWVKEHTVPQAEQFMKQSLTEIASSSSMMLSSFSGKGGSPKSVSGVPAAGGGKVITSKNLQGKLNELSLYDADSCVAKVTPERIYSVACHPNPNYIIACAGDKRGHVGIWNVDQYGSSAGGEKQDEESSDGVHLFKPFNGAVSSMTWNQGGTSLLAASYDGSVRSFDVEKQVFQEIFATYSDDEIYKDKLGFNCDGGYKSWVQCLELDHRFGSGECFFLSTSEGGVMHVDLRAKGSMTFDKTLSERKINSMSLHRDGNIMATAGLSTVVQLWDVRKMGDKKPKPIAWQNAGKSINSAFFSPSGKRLLSTTMMDHIDILEDAHLSSGLIKAPKTRIKHDNRTGRWLSTFMARWHPGTFSGEEIFVSGSMKKPRTIEVFGGDGSLKRELSGDALTAVASRCCFHPSAEKLIVVGGNSSGRLTIAR